MIADAKSETPAGATAGASVQTTFPFEKGFNNHGKTH